MQLIVANKETCTKKNQNELTNCTISVLIFETVNENNFEISCVKVLNERWLFVAQSRMPFRPFAEI